MCAYTWDTPYLDRAGVGNPLTLSQTRSDWRVWAVTLPKVVESGRAVSMAAACCRFTKRLETILSPNVSELAPTAELQKASSAFMRYSI